MDAASPLAFAIPITATPTFDFCPSHRHAIDRDDADVNVPIDQTAAARVHQRCESNDRHGVRRRVGDDHPSRVERLRPPTSTMRLSSRGLPTEVPTTVPSSRLDLTARPSSGSGRGAVPVGEIGRPDRTAQALIQL